MYERVSLIIPTYNRADQLRRLLESLRKARGDYQTIVVDDQSTDKTEEVAKKYDTDYVYGSGEGQLEAKQIGTEVAKGQFIGFLEDDMIVSESFLDPVMKKFQHGKDIIQSKVIFHDHDLEADSREPEYITKYRWNFTNVTNWHCGSEGRHISFTLESGRFIRKDVLNHVQLIDQNLLAPGFGESISFSFRARSKGYNIQFEPNSVIHHIGAERGGSSERFEKNLSSKHCSDFEFCRYHNMMYIHTRFFPEYSIPALVYHMFRTTAMFTTSGQDLSCLTIIPSALIKGFFTGIMTLVTNFVHL